MKNPARRIRRLSRPPTIIHSAFGLVLITAATAGLVIISGIAVSSFGRLATKGETFRGWAPADRIEGSEPSLADGSAIGGSAIGGPFLPFQQALESMQARVAALEAGTGSPTKLGKSGILTITDSGILKPTDHNQTQGGIGTDVSRIGKIWGTFMDLNDDVAINGKLDLSGKLTANGVVVLGNNSGDTIEVGGRFTSNLVPSQNNAVDLGTTSLRWRTGYFVNSIVVGSATTTITGTGITTDKISSNSNGLINLVATGTLQLDTSTNNTNILLLTGTGNVGIGTTAPVYKLDVNGTLRTTSTARVEGALTVTTGGASVTGDLTLDGDLDFTGPQNITTTADNLTLSPTGNLIIDTSGGTLAIRDGTIDLTNQPTLISGSSLTLRSTGTFILDTSAQNTDLKFQAGTGNLTSSSGTINLTAITDSVSALYLNSQRGGITLSSSNASGAGPIRILSGGSLQLSTSQGNQPIYLQAGTGNLNVSSTQLYLTGNLVVTGTETFNGRSYTFPGSETANGVLISDGSGILSWATIGGSNVTNDSLDFAELQDNLDLDADTLINGPYSFIVRAGNAARQNATSGSNDLQLSAQDYLLLDASRFRLATSSAADGVVQIISSGTLLLDTSTNNTDILLNQGSGRVIISGTGNVGIGSTAPAYKLDVAGNLRTTSTARIEGALTVTTGGAGITGDLTLDGDLDFTGPQNITTTADNLTLSPTGNLIIDTSGGTLAIRDGTIDLTNQPTLISGSSLTLRSTGTFILDTSAQNTDLKFQAGTGNLTSSAGTINLTAINDSVSALYLNSQRGGITLSSSNASGAGPIRVLSGGSLQLSTSQGNQPIYLQAGTGNLNVSSTQLYLTGNLVVTGTETFNGVTYTFPGADGSSGQALTTNASGILSWSTIGVSADSLDFTDFKDTLTMDSDTAVNGDYSFILRAGLGAIQNSTSGSNDLQLSAKDKLILGAASFDLLTSSGAVDIISGSYLDLSSKGTLTLDTSQNNTNILLLPGTGKIGIGTTAPAGLVDILGAGDIIARLTGANDFLLRVGDAAAENLTDGNDIMAAASDQMFFRSAGFNLTTSSAGNSSIILRSTNGGIQLSTGSTALGEIRLLSSGSLTLDTSLNNSNIKLVAGTGRIDLSGNAILLNSGTGTLTLSSESGVTVGNGITAEGNINSKAGGLQTNSVTRVSNSGAVSASSFTMDTSPGKFTFQNGFYLQNVSPSSVGLYDTGANLVITFDEDS